MITFANRFSPSSPTRYDGEVGIAIASFAAPLEPLLVQVSDGPQPDRGPHPQMGWAASGRAFRRTLGPGLAGHRSPGKCPVAERCTSWDWLLPRSASMWLPSAYALKPQPAAAKPTFRHSRRLNEANRRCEACSVKTEH